MIQWTVIWNLYHHLYTKCCSQTSKASFYTLERPLLKSVSHFQNAHWKGFKTEGKTEGGREKGEKKSLNSKSTTSHRQPPAGQQSYSHHSFLAPQPHSRTFHVLLQSSLSSLCTSQQPQRTPPRSWHLYRGGTLLWDALRSGAACNLAMHSQRLVCRATHEWPLIVPESHDRPGAWAWGKRPSLTSVVRSSHLNARGFHYLKHPLKTSGT